MCDWYEYKTRLWKPFKMQWANDVFFLQAEIPYCLYYPPHCQVWRMHRILNNELYK